MNKSTSESNIQQNQLVNINITSKYKPIKKKLEKYILRKTTYNYLPFVKPDNEQLNKIKQFVSSLTKLSESYITDEVIFSIKNIHIKDKIIYSHSKIKQLIKEIISLYSSETNTNIYLLSQLYSYPALTLIKIILQHKYPNLTKKEVKNLFVLNNNETQNKLLSSYDYFNIKMAKEIDEYSIVDESIQLIEATKFEHTIEKLLILHNIKYKTQEQLVADQIKQFGQPISTPDFLLEEPIIFDTMTIKWIDAKNFFGANSNFLFDKIKDQTKKYIKNYGDGLIVFSHGYSLELQKKFKANIKFAHINDLV